MIDEVDVNVMGSVVSNTANLPRLRGSRIERDSDDADLAGSARGSCSGVATKLILW